MSVAAKAVVVLQTAVVETANLQAALPRYSPPQQ